MQYLSYENPVRDSAFTILVDYGAQLAKKKRKKQKHAHPNKVSAVVNTSEPNISLLE